MTTIENLPLTWKERLRRFTNTSLERRWHNVGLLAKMGLLVEVGVVGLIAIFLFLGVSAARQSTQQILSERVQLARLSAASLDSTFQHVRSVLVLFAEHSALQLMTQAERQAALEDALGHVAEFGQGIYLLDAGGEIIASAGDRDRLIQLPSESLDDQAPNSPRLVLSPAGEPAALITQPIWDDAGDLEGWLAVTMDFRSASLDPFQTSIDLGNTGTMDLIDAQGRVLISSYPERAMTASALQELQKMFQSGEPMVETCLGCGGGRAPEGQRADGPGQSPPHPDPQPGTGEHPGGYGPGVGDHQQRDQAGADAQGVGRTDQSRRSDHPPGRAVHWLVRPAPAQAG